MTLSTSTLVSRASGLLAMVIIAHGFLNTASAGEFYSITAIASQALVPHDPYKLSAKHVTDQLAIEYVDQIIEDLDHRLPTELHQTIAAAY